MKKAIVTGAGGFIGRSVTKKLLENGYFVYGLDINKESLSFFSEYENFVPIIADFSHYTELKNLISDKDIDVFFHFAIKGGLEGGALKDYAVQLENAKFACDALNVAKELECKKFVFAGTANEYEIVNYINNQCFEPRYTCIYSTAKLAAELICKTYAHNIGIEYSAGLIAMAYGEGNRSKQLVNIVVNQLNNGLSPRLIEGSNLYDMVYIEDIANAFLAIAEKGKNMKSYYIGHRNLRTFRDIFTEVRDILNPKVELQFGAFKDSSNMDYSLINLDALYNDTGFECSCDFRESILKTAEWVKTLNWGEN